MSPFQGKKKLAESAMKSSGWFAAAAVVCGVFISTVGVWAQHPAPGRSEPSSGLTLPHPDILGGANVPPPRPAPANTTLVPAAPKPPPAAAPVVAPPAPVDEPPAAPAVVPAQPVELLPIGTLREEREIRRPGAEDSPPGLSAPTEDSTSPQARLHDDTVLRPKSGVTSMWRISDLWPLGAVLLLIAGLALFVRRFLPARRLLGGVGAMEIVARLPVSSRQHLLLVKVGRRLVLLGVTGDRINTLMLVDEPEEVGLLLGEAASHRAGSSSEAFSRALLDESDEYGPVGAAEPATLTSEARGQIRGLLDRVRRLGDSRGVA